MPSSSSRGRGGNANLKMKKSAPQTTQKMERLSSIATLSKNLAQPQK